MLCIKCRAPLPEGAAFCPVCGKKQVQEKRKALKRANGTGTVYKLQGRRSRPWVAAKNRVIIGYYERKTDALEALAALTGRNLTAQYNMTFSQVYAAWSKEHFQDIGPKGEESYRRAYVIFTPLHEKKFRDLRAGDFQAVIDAHRDKSASTLSKYKQLITQMSAWAVREEVANTNFASFVKIPESVKKEKEIFSPEEIAALEADDSDAAKIVIMLIYTGMRIGELFDLPLSGYHETYVVGGEKTEAGRNRVIPIPRKVQSRFSYFAERATGPLFLSGYCGQRVARNFRNRDYYPLLDRLGIRRHTPHATRHTFASMARKAGVPPETLQKILGHADYATTANIYLHTDPLDLVSAVESL